MLDEIAKFTDVERSYLKAQVCLVTHCLLGNYSPLFIYSYAEFWTPGCSCSLGDELSLGWTLDLKYRKYIFSIIISRRKGLF